MVRGNREIVDPRTEPRERRLPLLAGLGSFLRRCRATLRLWRQHARQRQALSELDDHLLADIGVTRVEAERECAKPFWRSSAHEALAPASRDPRAIAAALLYLSGR